MEETNPSMKLIEPQKNSYAFELTPAQDRERPPMVAIPAYWAKHAECAEVKCRAS